MRSLVNHSVPGVERIDPVAGTVTRLVRTASGVAPVAVDIRAEGVAVRGAADPETVELVREWFDLDTDLDRITRAFDPDPVLGPLVRERPAVRVIGHPDGFEAAVQTVLGQQVSLAACRTFTGRLALAYGSPGADGLIEFPDAAIVAAAELEELRAAVGIPLARARTVIALAGAFASGLRIGRSSDPGAVRAELLALPGIGPWTVDYLALRVLRDPDAYPVGDLVLRRALGGVSPAEALELGERWRPWRAYATMHLWTADAAGTSGASSVRTSGG
ncbi:DNA-3-methyladenine glycosylase 2 family protein [Planctomonas sp. JC2975]|nr:DNA-3-methyladenine glycosylase 2 family protein [Planctomonas sp. JC2975]NNC10370.1 DNA-3-methyladenine glycosylase 2 family protein [Planctomonas sp. JC2975]